MATEYNAKIITDSGATVDLGYHSGIIFDISPLSGADVILDSMRGFSQIGETINTQSVEGITRTISGVVLNRAAASHLLTSLPVFTKGKLYFNGDRYCAFTVKSTPMLHTEKNDKTTFSMRIRCETPFWNDKDKSYFFFNEAHPDFSFPTELNNHVFGTVPKHIYMNCRNHGDVHADAAFRFVSLGTVQGYGVENVFTKEKIEFNNTLQNGDEVIVYSKHGRVIAEKISDGEISECLFYLTDDSTLFKIAPGDNFLKPFAKQEAQKEMLKVSVSFNASFMGVIP